MEHDSSAANKILREAENEIVSVVRVLDEKELFDSLAFDKDYLESNIERLI